MPRSNPKVSAMLPSKRGYGKYVDLTANGSDDDRTTPRKRHASSPHTLSSSSSPLVTSHVSRLNAANNSSGRVYGDHSPLKGEATQSDVFEMCGRLTGSKTPQEPRNMARPKSLTPWTSHRKTKARQQSSTELLVRLIRSSAE